MWLGLSLGASWTDFPRALALQPLDLGAHSPSPQAWELLGAVHGHVDTLGLFLPFCKNINSYHLSSTHYVLNSLNVLSLGNHATTP